MLRVTTRARDWHPWVFSNEIVDPPVKDLPAGGVVEVFDNRGRPLGRGYANPHSLISVRIMGGREDDLDSVEFLERRLRAALDRRRRLLPGRESYRACYGDGDGLPGLAIDRYGDVLSVQVATLGMEVRRPQLRTAIEAVFAPRGVVFRGDMGLRALEGLPLVSERWWGDVPERVRFEENGVAIEADLLHGQKTGFFFDQAENRRFWCARAAGCRVLDVFAHLGAWAVGAMNAGATSAVAIDGSASACAGIARTAALNGVPVEVIESDAREAMARLPERSFDLVSVDPPAFAKTRKLASKALGAYKAVNAAGARLVAPGGLLFASSCSHHVFRERWEEAVAAGIRAAGRRGVLVHRGGQAPDHPILPGVPETDYLKHGVWALD